MSRRSVTFENKKGKKELRKFARYDLVYLYSIIAICIRYTLIRLRARSYTRWPVRSYKKLFWSRVPFWRYCFSRVCCFNISHPVVYVYYNTLQRVGKDFTRVCIPCRLFSTWSLTLFAIEVEVDGSTFYMCIH